ncbi:peptide chain release factor N(5)-glutamine methyltransferase [Mesocricetibacter intestinalis]|uniref:peptide chain release factor N(5)-glutamine methyltransferase n=1 Tax=Mesocricetibacter intestinalis TaxID=1521930 RepID=UPI00105FEC0C|nr:peptide chain release factor N(5)-glutamine methyltransferase [Mesocricetibacter intestinalis]
MSAENSYSSTLNHGLSYGEWLNRATEILARGLAQDPFLNPKGDAILLLQYVSGRTKSALLAFAETPLEREQLARLEALLARRSRGEPMAYILGETEFWSLSLEVSPATLIPRPDTEILVEQALSLAKSAIGGLSCGAEFALLDLGTGSGAIALALAAELQAPAERQGVSLKVWGADFVPEAVALAQRNGRRNGLDWVSFKHSDWFADIDYRFDMIVANPPYIAPADSHLHRGDLRFEPLSALVAPEQGYGDLRHIIQSAPDYLKQEGWLLLEHGWLQGEKVRRIFLQNSWEQVATVRDYGDNDRVTMGCRKKK